MCWKGSIKENILIGRPSASDEEVAEAATLAMVFNSKKEYDENKDVQIGNRGTKVNGGMRQRIVLGRAVLRNCDFLILDEP